MVERGYDRLKVSLTAQTGTQQPVAAVGLIGNQVAVLGQHRFNLATFDHCEHPI